MRVSPKKANLKLSKVAINKQEDRKNYFKATKDHAIIASKVNRPQGTKERTISAAKTNNLQTTKDNAILAIKT